MTRDAFAEIERRLADHPDDIAAHLVYADALQQRGDPRGALIALQHRRAADPHDPALAAAERELFASHPEFVDDIAAHGIFTWRLGFIDHASLYERSPADLDAVLRHRSCRRLRSLDLSLAYGTTIPAIEVLASAHRPSLRALALRQGLVRDDDGDDWVSPRHEHYAADGLWTQLPALQTLELRGWDSVSTLALANLSELVIADGCPFCSEGNGPWRVPALRKVSWSIATDLTGLGVDVMPEYLDWLWRADLPALRHLDLSGAGYSSLVSQPLLDINPLRALFRRLEILWLDSAAIGETGDDVVNQLTANHRDLSHLHELAITRPRDGNLAILADLAKPFPQLRWL